MESKRLLNLVATALKPFDGDSEWLTGFVDGLTGNTAEVYKDTNTAYWGGAKFAAHIVEETLYQGWKNYETWAVALHLDNDRETYERWKTRAQTLKETLSTKEEPGIRCAAGLALGDELKAQFVTLLDRHKGITRWAKFEKGEKEALDNLTQSGIESVEWYDVALHFLWD